MGSESRGAAGTEPVLEERVRALIAVGASVAAHCRPCLDFHAARAREAGVAPREIAEAAAVGLTVAQGATTAMRTTVERLADEPPGRKPDARGSNEE